MKKFIKIILISFICLLLCSCSLFVFDHTRFEGGKPLSDELMSEIKGEIFDSNSSQDTSNGESDAINGSNNSDSESDTINNSNNSETDLIDNGSSDTIPDEPITNTIESTPKTENSSDSENAENNKVYWIKDGTVWHLFEDCYHMGNNTDIISGTEDEAKAAGKKRLCLTCNNKTQ